MKVGCLFEDLKTLLHEFFNRRGGVEFPGGFVLKKRNVLLGGGFSTQNKQNKKKKTSCKMRPSNVAATFLDPNWIPPNHAKGHAKNIHLEQRSKAIGDT